MTAPITIKPPPSAPAYWPTDGILVPKDVHSVIRTHVEKDKPLELAEPTPMQDAALARVLSILFDAGIEIRYPIKIAELGTQTLAQAMNGTIVLTTKAFATDQRLMECLLEEALHIATGHGDHTRAFQTAIFAWWTSTILKAVK